VIVRVGAQPVDRGAGVRMVFPEVSEIQVVRILDEGSRTHIASGHKLRGVGQWL
jgi:hypothetical protein